MPDVTPRCTIHATTAGDGYPWKYRRYLPDEPPLAHVVCVHGIQSHGGWYEYSCERLRQAGFAVSFLDRRGSGLNEVQRGDAPSFRRLLDDISEFLLLPVKSADGQTTRSQLPTFLAAISWGGKLAVAMQRRHPGLIQGLVLLCPGFFPKVKPARLQRLGIAFNRLFRPGRHFPIPLNDPELFTSNPARQQFIRDDPLSLRQASARLLVESVRLDFYLKLAPEAMRVPLLLLLAGQDRIINNAATRTYVEKFATPDRQIIEYPEAHHTLEFEPEPDRFIDDWIGWLRVHQPAR
ncbi:MAG: alpha/beta fold hydrolase [Gemmataceae bacterium]